MAEQRAESSAARMADGAGMSPQYFLAFDGDPRSDVGATEKALPIAEVKALFGAPTTASGTDNPADGDDLPSDFEPNALDTKPFIYINENTGINWTYDPTNNVWHGEGYQEVTVPNNNVEEFTTGSFLAGFDRSHIRSVQLEQIAGTEELSIARWDRMVANTLRVKFRGQQLTAGNHKLIIFYKK